MSFARENYPRRLLVETYDISDASLQSFSKELQQTSDKFKVRA